MKIVEGIVLYWTDSQVCLSDLSGKMLRSYKGIPVEDGLTCEMMLLPKQQYLAIGLRNGYLCVCKYLSNLSVLFSIKAHLKPVNTLTAHPTYTNMVLTGSTDGFIRIWNVEVFP